MEYRTEHDSMGEVKVLQTDCGRHRPREVMKILKSALILKQCREK